MAGLPPSPLRTCAAFPFARPFFLLLLLACDRPPAPTREWSPKDHDRIDENSRIAAGAQASASPKGSSSAESSALVAEATWRQQCASCHGPGGRGDGPNGPLVQATNLTLPSWQDSITDEAMAAAIVQGKGKMPKFAFPETVVKALVVQIRGWRSEGTSRGAANTNPKAP